jgi:hypothetical protein
MPTKKDPAVPKAPRKRAPTADQSALIAQLQAKIAAMEAGGNKPEPRVSKSPDRLIEVENKRVRPEHYVGIHPKSGETVDFHFGTAPIAIAAGATPATVPGSNPYRVKLPLWLIESARFQVRVKKGHFEIRGSI